MADKNIDWQEVIKEWKASGLSQEEFAKQRGLKGYQISYHLHGGKYGKRAKKAEPKNSQKASTFLRVGAPETIQIETPKGIKLHIPTTVSTEQLRKILEAL